MTDSAKPSRASQALMEHSPNRVSNSPSLIGEQTYNPLSALTVEEREGFLRFVWARLPDGVPLKCRIHAAVEMISHNPEHSLGKAMAEEIQETEIAAWRAIENQNERALLVQAELKRRGGTKLRVDRTTIYRLVKWTNRAS
jgi:hypothetical protein